MEKASKALEQAKKTGKKQLEAQEHLNVGVYACSKSPSVCTAWRRGSIYLFIDMHMKHVCVHVYMHKRVSISKHS